RLSPWSPRSETCWSSTGKGWPGRDGDVRGLGPWAALRRHGALEQRLLPLSGLGGGAGGGLGTRPFVGTPGERRLPFAGRDWRTPLPLQGEPATPLSPTLSPCGGEP